MSIKTKKTASGKMPSQAYISFSGRGHIKLEMAIGDSSNKEKMTPTAIKYLVLDDDFTEISGIKHKAPQEQGVRSNVCYGIRDRYFKVQLKNGTRVAAGPWMQIKDKCELYGGKFVNFAFALLLKVEGTPYDDVINAQLAKLDTLCKVSVYGRTSFALGSLNKKLKTNDLAGHVIDVKSFTLINEGTPSYVPDFEGVNVDNDERFAKVLKAGITVYEELVEPYIEFVSAGGDDEEVKFAPTREAEVDDFLPEVMTSEEEKEMEAAIATAAAATVTGTASADDLPF